MAAKGGGKLTRSETVTVRLDPRLRYLADLAARKQRRTLSSFIEWAIEDALRNAPIADVGGGATISVSAVGHDLWDTDDADRFAKLALRFPELLTHQEQLLWKVVCAYGFLWRGGYGAEDRWTWSIKENGLMFDRLRDNWETLKAIAAGEADKSALPKWPEFKPKPKPDAEKKPNDTDPDMPF